MSERPLNEDFELGLIGLCIEFFRYHLHRGWNERDLTRNIDRISDLDGLGVSADGGRCIVCLDGFLHGNDQLLGR